MIELKRPSIEYLNSIQEYKTIFNYLGESLAGGAFLNQYDDLNEWLKFVKRLENKETTPANLTPAYAYILVDTTTNTVIGMCDFRLELFNDYLRQFGGNVGYSIHPHYRQKGYGTLQLKLLLDEIKALGFTQILVTCNADNNGSRKIIENNNGKFESFITDDDHKLRRYWINL